MAVLKIGGEAIASPSEMKVTVFDVGSEEARSASGALVVDRLGRKRRLSLKWAHLTPVQLGQLLRLTGPAFFQAEYPDPETMDRRVMVCRCAQCGVGVLRMLGGEPVWTDVEMEWLER